MAMATEEEFFYTEEMQNGLKLIALHFDEGTRVLRKIFDREVRDNHPKGLKDLLLTAKENDQLKGLYPYQQKILFPTATVATTPATTGTTTPATTAATTATTTPATTAATTTATTPATTTATTPATMPTTTPATTAATTPTTTAATTPTTTAATTAATTPTTTPATTAVDTSENFDITLLINLLRKLCDKTAEPSWGKPPKPPVEDKSEEAWIIRLQLFRNEIAHRANISLSKPEFDQLWEELSEILIALGGDKNTISQRKTQPISPDQAEVYKEKLEKLIREGFHEIKDELSNKMGGLTININVNMPVTVEGAPALPAPAPVPALPAPAPAPNNNLTYRYPCDDCGKTCKSPGGLKNHKMACKRGQP